MTDFQDRDSTLEAALETALAERDAWAQALFESNRLASKLVISRQELTDRLAALERQGAEERQAFDQALNQAVAQGGAVIAARDAAEATLARVLGSTTWRLTSPLRRVVSLLLGRPRGDW